MVGTHGGERSVDLLLELILTTGNIVLQETGGGVRSGSLSGEFRVAGEEGRDGGGGGVEVPSEVLLT
jgi:hypothetical protein